MHTIYRWDSLVFTCIHRIHLYYWMIGFGLDYNVSEKGFLVWILLGKTGLKSVTNEVLHLSNQAILIYTTIFSKENTKIKKWDTTMYDAFFFYDVNKSTLHSRPLFKSLKQLHVIWTDWSNVIYMGYIFRGKSYLISK